MSSAKTTNATSVWAAPAVLGVLMSAGLIAALVGDGLWDALACILLTGTLSYAAYAAFAPGA